MKTKKRTIWIMAPVLAISIGFLLPNATAQSDPYPKMAPIDQYLMPDQGAEIALARSAAPESISRDAEVLILGRHGFETAVKGKNGFVCIVATQAQMTESITAAIAKNELPAMESGAMCYMLSKQGYAGDSTPHWPPHLMFFYSDTDPAIWGANLQGSPVLGVNDTVEHLTSFVVPVQRWSDGADYREGSVAEHHH